MNAAASSSTLKSTPTRSAAASTASKSASASSTRAIKASMAEGAEEVGCDKVWMPGALQRNLFGG